MKPCAWIGIDPGKSGAGVVIFDGGHLVSDWPGDPAGAAAILAGWLDHFEIRLAALEKVGARPGQGVSSMFAFGRNLGAWEGLLAALRIPYVMPTPQQWQKGLVMPSDGADPKERALAVARRLFPAANLTLKKHHGRADALLLAWWARRQTAA